MSERFGQCYIQKGNDGDELWFKTIAEFPKDMDDEKFIFQFESQISHIHDMMTEVFDKEDEYESNEDGDTAIQNEDIGNQEEVMTIFKYLKDAGLCEQEPEGNAIVFNLDGAERCFVVLEYGYFIYHDIWASEKQHHTFESEAEAADDIINDTPNMIQIYRIDDGEEHGMRFSWFFDEFPANNAEAFISDIKAVAEAMDSYIFYNFVQTPMSEPRKSPSVKEFQDSFAAFFEVLEQYRPDCVIAWGKRLYERLPPAGRQGKTVLLPDGTSLETWAYVLSDGKCVAALPIQHPSSGFSWDFWHEAIMGFLGGQL